MVDTLSLNINVFLRCAVKAIGSIVFMAKISWHLTIVTLIGLPVGLILGRFYGVIFRKIQKEVQNALADANALADEVISSVKTVRSFANEDGESKIYYEKTHVAYKVGETVKVADLSRSRDPWADLKDPRKASNKTSNLLRQLCLFQSHILVWLDHRHFVVRGTLDYRQRRETDARRTGSICALPAGIGRCNWRNECCLHWTDASSWSCWKSVRVYRSSVANAARPWNSRTGNNRGKYRIQKCLILLSVPTRNDFTQ